MPDIIMNLVKLRKILPNDKELLSNISLSFFHGAKIGIIGINGAGKSTLLRIIAGEDKDYLGEVILEPGVRVGYLPQEPQLDESLTVRGNVELGVKAKKDLMAAYDAISARFSEPLSDDEMQRVIDEQARLQDEIDAADIWDLDSQLEQAMEALRCPPGDAAVANLSGGEKRRVALTRILLERPDILMLDEPTNHLDAESVAWLERTLREYPGTVLIVTHDRYFLDNVTRWILELDRGKGIPYEGAYSEWLEQKAARLSLEDKSRSRHLKIIEQELKWVRSSQKAKQSKGKARLNAYEELAAQEQEERESAAQITIAPGPRLGTQVVEAVNLRKAYGDKLLFDALEFHLPRAGIVGVVGANGAGKTTLLRLLMGEEQPDAGELIIGETVKLSYVNQGRDKLDGDKTVYEEISGGAETIQVGNREINSRAYCGFFNFRGHDQQKQVKLLSGGERNRVHLAKLLIEGGNVLLLDEPSNDLDVETLRALEDAIERFSGCVVVVTHDRWFLDRIATHILAFEGDSQVLWFEGNWQAYDADRKRRLGKDADQPHRIKYRPLTR
jgi:ATP-binding cassette ChvD family protein